MSLCCYYVCYNCGYSPEVEETFDLRSTYKHVADWSDEYRHECDQLFWQNNLYVGEGMNGLEFEMLNWGEEAAKRVVCSAGFVLVDYCDYFEVDGEETDASLLWKRYIVYNVCRNYIVYVDRYELASGLLGREGESVCLRLRILAELSFKDVDHGTTFESANTTPFVVHCGKSGVQELWGLEDGDVVIVAQECFDDCSMRNPEQVWNAVLCACADAWLKKGGRCAGDRRKWLSRHLGKLNDAVIAAEQGEVVN